MKRGPVAPGLRRSEGGFTLLELLVVVAIIMILMAAMVSLFGGIGGRVLIERTEQQVHTIGCKLVAEAELEGRVPATLIEFEPKLGVPMWVQGGRIVDAWDRPLRYVPSGRTFRLWSAGPDGVSGNTDDIVFAD